jgi:hypothetical protein
MVILKKSLKHKNSAAAWLYSLFAKILPGELKTISLTKVRCCGILLYKRGADVIASDQKHIKTVQNRFAGAKSA